jgi:hypothetical protein
MAVSNIVRTKKKKKNYAGRWGLQSALTHDKGSIRLLQYSFRRNNQDITRKYFEKTIVPVKCS